MSLELESRVAARRERSPLACGADSALTPRVGVSSMDLACLDLDVTPCVAVPRACHTPALPEAAWREEVPPACARVVRVRCGPPSGATKRVEPPAVSCPLVEALACKSDHQQGTTANVSCSSSSERAC